MNNPPKILIVGDAMLDQYYFATTNRISPEAPIPVFNITELGHAGGGANNVRENLIALGADVRIVGGTTIDGAIPVKNRLMVGDVQVARWDQFDRVESIPLEDLDRAILHWTPDAIVVSDYGKGSISDEVIKWLSEFCGPIFIDTKRHPGDFCYSTEQEKRLTYFPNQSEYEHWLQGYKNRAGTIIYKRGASGIQEIRKGCVLAEFPAYARNVVSVCGAGDVVIANYAYATALGRPDALFRSSIAAAIAVEKPFTATVTNEEIDERIKCLDLKSR